MKRTYLVVQRKTKEKLQNRINKLLEKDNCELVGGLILHSFNHMYIQAVLVKDE